MNDMLLSSPEPSGSQGELIVYPCSSVRHSSLVDFLKSSQEHLTNQSHLIIYSAKKVLDHQVFQIICL